MEKLTLKDVSLYFNTRPANAVFTGSIDLCSDVCDFLKTTGHVFDTVTDNNTFFCTVSFNSWRDDRIKEETDELKRAWNNAVAASENGCKKDCFMENYAMYSDGDECYECNRNLSLRLLACGRLELATANHDDEELIYSESVTDVVNNMSFDTVKYLASILNERLQKGE